MTPALQTVPDTFVRPAPRRAWIFGSGFGIAIGAKSLEASVVRARPGGPSLLAARTVRDFRVRPAAEWGAELSALLHEAGESGLAATAALPRDETIVRVVELPGVADKDLQAALELQIDTLHPWGDLDGNDAISWGYARTGPASILVGIARKSTLDTYETLFAEAGIQLAAITFSPSVIYSALRFWNTAAPSVLCFTVDDRGRTEIYGESQARGVYSAELPAHSARPFAIARAELRLPPDFAETDLASALPAPSGNAVPASPVSWAAALCGAAPRAASIANLLPPERRVSHNRGQYILPAALAALLVIALLGVFVLFPALDSRRYRDELDAAARRLEPSVLRAQSLDKQAVSERARTASLDDLRGRTQADLDVLNELTRLLPPPIWTMSVEIYPDSVVVVGEADQAASLLRIMDSSPLLQNSEFVVPVSRQGQLEQFRIRTTRRGRAGRTTP